MEMPVFVCSIDISGRFNSLYSTVNNEVTTCPEDALDEIEKNYPVRGYAWPVFAPHVSVTVPTLSRQGIIASSVPTWAKAVGEFGATITVAGSMAMKTETLPVAIFMRLSGADIEGTAVLVLILITIGLSVLYGVRLFAGKKSYALE